MSRLPRKIHLGRKARTSHPRRLRHDMGHIRPSDQSPLRRGMQWIINLSTPAPKDGGSVVYPGSHRLVEEFSESQTERESWTKVDQYPFTEEQVAWFEEEGGEAG
ncbi:hypothetical protein BBP40_000132 [Aspergillus hancockii]|nr:hypothetical protein BBP40_000132 [Aspergillus hancockii]